MKRLLALVYFFCFFGSFSYASAQAIDNFSISSKPDYPAAGEETLISIDSFSTDLARSKVTWKENNTVVAQDTGLTQKTFIAPRDGESKTITVEVLTQSGYKLTNSYTLAPQSLDILWEAPDSWVPPFYKGKALAGEQALVRVVAIPNFTQKGILQDRTQTVYTWSLNGVRSENFSGYNKPFLNFSFDPFKKGSNIKVIAGTVSNKTQTENNLFLTPVRPQIIFYEKSPLLGVLFERAFTRGLNLVTPEITLFAAPYYFSGSDNLTSNLGFVWKVDNVPVNVGSDPTNISLKSPGKSGGTTIGLTIKSIENSLQNLSVTLPIVYDK